MRTHNPAHPGEIARDNMETEGWTVTQCASRLGVSRIALSRLLNCRAGVSASMALALERIGWGAADHWVRMQRSYDLAQERQKRTGAPIGHFNMPKSAYFYA